MNPGPPAPKAGIIPLDQADISFLPDFVTHHRSYGTDTIHSSINLFILSTDVQNQHNIAMPSPSKKTFSSIKNILLGHKLILMEEPFKLIAFIIGLRSITFRSQCTIWIYLNLSKGMISFVQALY